MLGYSLLSARCVNFPTTRLRHRVDKIMSSGSHHLATRSFKNSQRSLPSSTVPNCGAGAIHATGLSCHSGCATAITGRFNHLRMRHNRILQIDARKFHSPPDFTTGPFVRSECGYIPPRQSSRHPSPEPPSRNDSDSRALLSRIVVIPPVTHGPANLQLAHCGSSHAISFPTSSTIRTSTPPPAARAVREDRTAPSR